MTIKRRFVWVLYYATVLIKKSCESKRPRKLLSVKGTGSTILIFHTFIKHMDSNAQLTGQDHKSIKARGYRGLWLFTASFVLDKQLHLCCLLKYEGKKKYQSKVPSINKLCFLFPLSPFSPMLYLLVFEFSIVTVNNVKELGRFCLM